MVRVILDGRKTQTRRIVKPQPVPEPARASLLYEDQWIWESNSGKVGIFQPSRFKCPYGAVNSKLWVKETFMPDPPRDGTWASTPWEDDMRLREIPERFRMKEHVIYRSTWDGSELSHWKPSIFMPSWASRITLEITGIRVERLQEITEQDVAAEGLRQDENGLWTWGNYPSGSSNPVYAYQLLWESVNGPDSWTANPWVWVITFKKL